jgi:hypothetical protein
MGEFNSQPIVNSTAPGGACTLLTFDDIGTFILSRVDVPRRLYVVYRDLGMPSTALAVGPRFGARRAKVHAAMRNALAVEGWLAA